MSFLPDEDFTGTVSISFTGYDTAGDRFSGTVTVEVAAPRVSAILYTTSGGAAALRAADFTSACRSALPGGLSRVRFTLPAAAAGRLYYNYDGPTRYDSAVSAAVDYAVSASPFLNNVSFVPRAGFQGTAVIPFTGWDSRGNSCAGTVQIAVAPPSASPRFTDMGAYGWAVPAVEFLYQYGVVSGTSASTYAPGAPIRRGEFALMLQRAFRFPAASGGFSDVPADSPYAAAVAAVSAQGVVSGFGDGTFRPGAALSRQQAAVMLHRALGAAGVSTGPGGTAALSGYQDRGAVSAYAAEALSDLVSLGVFQGDAAGRLSPGGTLTRAQMAVILHRALTL